MSKRQFLIILGVWVMVFLFLKFPAEWDKMFALVTGFFIIIATMRSKSIAREDAKKQVSFVEHRQQDMRPRSSSQPNNQPAAPISNTPSGTIIKTDTTTS